MIGYKGGGALCGALDLRFFSGEPVAIIGDNGAGKSTLLRTLCHLQRPLSGRVLLGGADLAGVSAAERSRHIAYVSTEPILATYTTVYQLIALGRIPYSGWAGRLSAVDHRAIVLAMEQTGILDLGARSIDTLSDGQRQRVMIARGLCQSTDVLILDEPTAFLDNRNRRSIIELLHALSRDLGKVVIYSTHEVGLAVELGARVVEIAPF